MSTFKIGDKVRVVGCTLFSSCSVNREGDIYRFDEDQVYVRFLNDDYDTDYGLISEIELVKPPTPLETHTTLSQKLDALDKLTAEIRAMVGLTPNGGTL